MSRPDPIVPPSPVVESSRPRRRRWARLLIPVLVVVLALVIAGFTVNLNYYALMPGTAQAVAGLITLPKDKTHQAGGSIYLTDVTISRVRLIDLVPDLLSSDTSLVKAGEILGPLPPDQFTEANALAMDESKQAAEVAALRRLGYQVPGHEVGAQVLGVASNAPASGSLNVGDTVTSVGGTPTPDAAQLVAVLHSHAPGEVVELSVLALGGSVRQVSIRLGHHEVAGNQQPYLGVSLGTKFAYALPFPITINSENIGGPSAGLAFTLGLVNGLTSGDITGGKKVAATGTMDVDGHVGDVGGVAQKTVAVQDAGATLFFVPPEELTVARQHARPGLRVVAVSTLDQALTDLGQLGGNLSSVPAAPSGQGIVGSSHG